MSVDALTQKVREGGRIVGVHALIPMAVSAEANAKSSVSTSSPRRTAERRSCARWLRPIRRRVGPVRRARPAGPRDRLHFAGAAWQRCRTHFARNLSTKVPKFAQPWVLTLLRTVFEQSARRPRCAPSSTGSSTRLR